MNAMSSLDTRDVGRDSLFLLAELKFDNGSEGARVKVRNLSAGGMMAEGAVVTERGARVIVTLRHVGDVRGTVAWVQGQRFGIAFEGEIDPKLVRAPVGTGDQTPRYTRSLGIASPPDPATLRKL